jgi:hypothetical protein
LWAAYLCSASIALAVDVAWYLDSARAAAGWNGGAVAFRALSLLSADPSACGAISSSWYDIVLKYASKLGENLAVKYQ